MFTIYNGKIYKLNGNKMVGVSYTPTTLEFDMDNYIDVPSSLNRVLSYKEIVAKFGGEYKFPKLEIEPSKEEIKVEVKVEEQVDEIKVEKPIKKETSKPKAKTTTKKKVDKDEPTSKTKKTSGKSK